MYFLCMCEILFAGRLPRMTGFATVLQTEFIQLKMKYIILKPTNCFCQGAAATSP